MHGICASFLQKCAPSPEFKNRVSYFCEKDATMLFTSIVAMLICIVSEGGTMRLLRGAGSMQKSGGVCGYIKITIGPLPPVDTLIVTTV